MRTDVCRMVFFIGPIKKVDFCLVPWWNVIDFCLVPWRNVSVKGTLGKSLNKLKDVVNAANFFGVLSNLRLVDVLKIIIFIADGSLRYISHYNASKSTLSFLNLLVGHYYMRWSLISVILYFSGNITRNVKYIQCGCCVCFLCSSHSMILRLAICDRSYQCTYPVV